MNEHLKQYLNRHLEPKTIKTYLTYLDHFFISFEKKNLTPKTATYNQILEYIGEKRSHYKNSDSLNCILNSIKYYFDYLIEMQERTDNPVKSIKLRDKQSKDIQVQDLFTTQELELLLNRKERYLILKNRNQFIISLLIYQGFKTAEIANLELLDIDLKEGTVTVKPSIKTNSRTLKLKANQVYFLMNYLNLERPKLIKETMNKLLISKLGNIEKGEGIHYLIESSKFLFPTKKLNPVTIRQSVIYNLLKAGNDLRIVQAFAGHKHPSTTEKYKQTHLEELKNQVLKFHPLQ
jgi:integrase/recombinase XerD